MDEYLISPRALTESMQEAWRGEKAAPDNILLTIYGYFLVIFIFLAQRLSSVIKFKETHWEALTPIIINFDYIIIDTPPLGLLSINAMCAANWVMVPVQAEYYAWRV